MLVWKWDMDLNPNREIKFLLKLENVCQLWCLWIATCSLLSFSLQSSASGNKNSVIWCTFYPKFTNIFVLSGTWFILPLMNARDVWFSYILHAAAAVIMFHVRQHLIFDYSFSFWLLIQLPGLTDIMVN